MRKLIMTICEIVLMLAVLIMLMTDNYMEGMAWGVFYLMMVSPSWSD